MREHLRHRRPQRRVAVQAPSDQMLRVLTLLRRAFRSLGRKDVRKKIIRDGEPEREAQRVGLVYHVVV